MARFWTSLDSRLRGLLLVLLFVLLAVAWFLGSPLFLNRTVDEAFPAAVAPMELATPAPQPTLAPTANGVATIAVEPAAAEVTASIDSAAAVQPAVTTDPIDVDSAAPVVLGRGTFSDVDAIHRGSGQAVLYELPDGQRVLRLEEFDVTNGPDLYVYLSGHSAPRSGNEVHANGDFEVARLKGNVGNQNYELPADLDLSAFQSVVIYCKGFSVVFSTAELGS